MPRPVNADAAATRQRILDTALNLFADRGVDGVSVRELAAGAKVSAAMIHHCFGGKEGLHQAAIETMYGSLKELSVQLVQELAGPGVRTPSEIFERATRLAFRFSRKHQASVRLLMRDVMAHGELDEKRRESTQIPFMQRTSMLLAGLLDTEPSSLRLPLQSAITLVARYAVSSDRELLLFADTEDMDKALLMVEEHLICATHCLLGLKRERPTSLGLS